MPPSERVTVVNVPLTPEPPLTVSPASSVNGGQESTQPVLDAPFVDVSGLNMYSVLPSSPVRNLPYLVLLPRAISYAVPDWDASAEAAALAATGAGGCVAAVVGAVVWPVPALHAANRRALAARTPTRFRRNSVVMSGTFDISSWPARSGGRSSSDTPLSRDWISGRGQPGRIPPRAAIRASASAQPGSKGTPGSSRSRTSGAWSDGIGLPLRASRSISVATTRL